MTNKLSLYSSTTVKRRDDVDMSPHKILATKGLTPIGQKLFKYVEFDDEETLLAEVRKHPIGYIFTILGGTMVSVIFFTIPIFLAKYLDTQAASTLGSVPSDNSNLKAIIALVGFALTALSIFITWISVFLYRSDVVFVTDQKIAEVTYVSVFSRRTTQLAIGKVEDVTVSQNGIIAQIYKYGSLMIETAGESPSPVYTMIPMPNEVAKIIIKAHEDSIRRYGN